MHAPVWKWRKRPAYLILKCFADAMAGTVFINKLTPVDGVHMFLFRKDDGSRFIVGYSHGGWQSAPVPYRIREAFNLLGEIVKVPWSGNVPAGSGDMVTFTGRPIYLLLKE